MSWSERKGYSLVEMLVVIGILGILTGLMLPAVQRIRESANRLSCQNHLRQIGLACMNYHSARNRLPPYTENIRLGPNDQNFAPVQWTFTILPYR